MYAVLSRARAVLALVSLVPLALTAQQRPDTTSLSPVVVTATKIPVTNGASTFATTVVRAEDLKARGIMTFADALREVPGMTVNATSGPGSQTSLFLRGGNSNFTKVLVDGVPVNAPGGALDLATLSVDNIDRIEIVRGPASVQYGSDAMTGVVQIFTKAGGRSTLDLRAADRDGAGDATLELAREIVSPTGVRVRGSIGGGHHRTDGFLPFNNQYRAATASVLAGVDGVRGGASLAATLGDSRYHYPTTGSGEPTDSNAYTGARRTTVSLGGNWRPTTHLGVRLQLGSSSTRSLSDNQPDNGADTLGFYSHSTSDARRSTGDLQLFATLPLSGSLTAGVAGESQHVRSAGRSVFGRIALPDSRFDESRTDRAAYVQLVAGERPLTVDAGVRRERFGTGRGATTGRLGIASGVIPATIVRASIGTSFKEAALDELYATSFSVGNRELLPERNRSREIGAETRIVGGLLTLGMTVFDQRFANLVQYQFRGPGVTDFYNVVAARARGLELEGRLAEVKNVAIHATYTVLHTEVLEPGDGAFGTLSRGEPLLRRPARATSVDAGWHRGRVALNALVSSTGQRDDVDFATFPSHRLQLASYTRVDLAGQVALLRSRPERGGATDLWLTTRVENAGNASYENVAGYRAPGRVLFLGVRVAR